MRAIFSFLLLYSIASGSLAQSFQYESDITKVDSNGYYKIPLPADIVNNLNEYLSDIRIFDHKEKEISYLLKEERDSCNFTRIPERIRSIRFKQINKAGPNQTLLKVDLNGAKRITQIEFTVDGPPYFMRYGEIEYYDTLFIRKKKRRYYKGEKIYISLSSDGSCKYEIPEIKTKGLNILINNEDNPPLKFNEIKIFGPAYYLIAYLKKNNRYTLKFGQASLPFPHYDLEYFTSKIPIRLPEVKLKKVIRIWKSPLKDQPSFYETKIFMWSVILFLIIALSILSIRMVREISSNKKA